MDLTSLSLAEAARLVASQEVSPVELTRASLERIERLDSSLGSFITVTPERALEAAARAEADVAAGRPLGPLHGVPVAVKDCFDTKGIRTTAGSDFWRERVPDEDSTVVRQLSQSGAVMLGKLNMHEWAWGTTNINPHYGTCRNPWNTNHVAGGSSGGSAAAMAARFVFGAFGTDSGGSIRTPAAFCGIVGLKPSAGLVDLQGVTPNNSSLDHAGPMARTVRDVAMLLQATAITGRKPLSASEATARNYVSDIDAGTSGRRIALLDLAGFPEVEGSIADAVRDAADVYRKLGAEIRMVSLPELREARQANRTIAAVDGLALHESRLDSEPARFGPDVLKRLEAARKVTAVDYAKAKTAQLEFRRQFAALFHDFDVLLTPTSPVSAPLVEPPLDQPPTSTSISLFASPFNLTGLPALSVPAGFTPDGLPIGLQLVAGFGRDADLLQVGNAFERATGWHKAAPTL